MRSTKISILAFLISITFIAQTATAAPLSQEPNRVLYQIYVESFKDGSAKLGRATGSGNFEGLKDSLEYLKDLGVTGLLLMPIFRSGGMGYIPDDFFDIRQDYALESEPGKRDQAFRQFTRAAHEAGIKIFLDAPINHISRYSDWFKMSAKGEFGMGDWFLWSPEPVLGWRRPWQPDGKPSDVWHWDGTRNSFFYGLFSDAMPDLNHRNPSVIDTFNEFFSKYAELGADGFRIDAARHLVEGETNLENAHPDNLARLRAYLNTVRKNFPDQSFILEIWAGHHDIDPYLPVAGDVALDFPYMEGLRASLKGKHPYGIRNILKHIEATQDRIEAGNRVIFMGNHDIPRIRTFVENEKERVELSTALTLSLPETPLLYYGDEIFMPGDYIREKDNSTKVNEVCTPMAWHSGPNAGFTDPSITLGNDWNRKLHDNWQELNVASQSRLGDSLLNLVKRLTRARKTLPIDNQTRIRVAPQHDSDPVLTVAMTFADGSCSVGVYNFSPAPQNGRSISIPGICEDSHTSAPLLSRRATIREEWGNRFLDLSGYGFLWIRHSGT
ncbi:MAG TPA: alpha-amylase family glycosyl hydrolase [Bdellovibrionota bacterium]|nr:alpha-amylase family glycosyl hydrolase [Bdellovibrionota bacterium]